MKWSRGSGEPPSDEPFLVARHHPRSRPDSQEEADVGGGCETWPGMRRRRPREARAPSENDGAARGPERGGDGEEEAGRPGEEPRPATASLEAPLVLDPRLVDKLDMSLLSKESLTDSLARMSLSLARAPLDDAEGPEGAAKTPGNNGNNNSSGSGNDASGEAGPPRLPRPRARLATSARKPSLDSSATNSESDSRTSGAPAPAGSPEVRRLDDNNNRHRERSTGSPLTQLSPVRSRGPRNGLDSSDVALFTGGRSTGARIRGSLLPLQPCRACGRAAQPERFHSHPKSPPDSPGAGPKAPTAPTRLEILQRRLPGTVLDRLAASDQQLSARSTSGDEKTSSEQEAGFTRTERKASSATNPSRPNENKSATSIGKRRPRTVTCYVCGREFGTASFPIHEPKCLQKWHRENKALPSSQRRSVPQRPIVPIDHEDWNTAAWEQSQGCVSNSNYNRAQTLSRSELQRMDTSNLLSRARSEADDRSSLGQTSARPKPSRIAVRMDGARRIA